MGRRGFNTIVFIIVVSCLIYWSVVVPSQRSRSTFRLSWKQSAQQRRVLLLYHTDHQALLKAGRQIFSQGPKDLKNYQYYGPMHINGFPVPRGIRIPKVIRKLRPYASLINFNGYVVVQMKEGVIGFGVKIYPEGFREPRRYFSYGHRELLPGLWYFDEEYGRIPEYDKIIDEVIKNGKWEESNQIDLSQSANHQSSH